MAGKFVSLDEAAEQLGLTADKINEMRSNGEMHGYRDGSSWKFKVEEVERVAAELGADSVSAGKEAGADDLFDLSDLGDLSSERGDSVLDSDVEGDPGSGSTVVGKDEEASEEPAADSELSLALGEEVAPSGSDVLGEENSVSSGDDVGSDTGDLHAEEGSGLSLAPDSGALALGDDEDLMLGEGSDVTLGGGDSGINLESPSDSGLSLEDDALELGGDDSAVDSFELPDDDEVLSLGEDLDEGDIDGSGPVQADEEFLLSPSDEGAVEEGDSGSQVIALEDSEAFSDNAATMLGGAAAGLEVVDQAPVQAVDGMMEGVQPLEALGETPVAAVAAGAVGAVAAEPPEAPYNMGQVALLCLPVLFLALGGVLMMDVVRNMWSFDEPYSASSSLMTLFLQIFRIE